MTGQELAKASQVLLELQELMRHAAVEQTTQRSEATTYTNCREALLQSELRRALPGFVFQCLTIYRFKDFIQLYSPSAEERIAFIDEAFPVCEPPLRIKSTFDVFSDTDF